jgi:hypothetical protein
MFPDRKRDRFLPLKWQLWISQCNEITNPLNNQSAGRLNRVGSKCERVNNRGQRARKKRQLMSAETVAYEPKE